MEQLNTDVERFRFPHMTILDAIRAQPELTQESGFQAWLQNDDTDGLDAALGKWGFGPMNDDGTISDK